MYLTRAYKTFGEGRGRLHRRVDRRESGDHLGQYSLEPVYADLWCVARAADPGRGGYCDNTGYNQNRKEFIFTVQYTYTQRDDDVGGALSTTICISCTWASTTTRTPASASRAT